MISVMVDDCLAVLNDYEWTCENKEVEEFLNAMTQRYAPGTHIVDIEATIYSTVGMTLVHDQGRARSIWTGGN